MLTKPDIKTTRKMHALYQRGFSLGKVSTAFGVSRQAVWGRFVRSRLSIRRARQLPWIIFERAKYAPGKDGYWKETKGLRRLLHRSIWRKLKGPIPKGFDIHHRDKNRGNNDISNLECLSKSDHCRHHALNRNSR